MANIPDHDPLRKSSQETPNFNTVWLKNGEKMTWTQRIGFAVFSFGLFSSGLLFETLAIYSIRNEELLSLETLLGVICAVLAALVFIIPGLLGLRNVLRF